MIRFKVSPAQARLMVSSGLADKLGVDPFEPMRLTGMDLAHIAYVEALPGANWRTVNALRDKAWAKLKVEFDKENPLLKSRP